MEAIHRELIYIWYYFDIQFRQIAGYWVLGMLIGSFVSVFAKDRIHGAFARMNGLKLGVLGAIPASVLGILSPLCMYGTIPIAASFANKGMREDWLAAFMMSSVLLNPQLMMYSLALGPAASAIRLVSCTLCGIAAGFLVWFFYVRESTLVAYAADISMVTDGSALSDSEAYACGGAATAESIAATGSTAATVAREHFFDFTGFSEGASRDTDPNILLRYLKNLGRNIRATGPYFLIGILLSALFQRYVPEDLMTHIFGGNEAWGVLMAATIGVPLYVCGGGTIPLLQEWLLEGMSLGSAASFMITGPATKITNLGALKIVLGGRNFAIYIAFTLIFAFATGILVNLLI